MNNFLSRMEKNCGNSSKRRHLNLFQDDVHSVVYFLKQHRNYNTKLLHEE